MRRLADYYLNRARTWDEMKKAHRKFIRDYNTHIHFAHRERRDNRHSLKACAPGSACAHGRSFNLSPHLLRNALYPPSGSMRIHPFPQVANLSGSRASPRNQWQFTSTQARSRPSYQDTELAALTRWSGRKATVFENGEQCQQTCFSSTRSS
jgi:hypothetical protein